MQTHTYRVHKTETVTHFVETPEDLRELDRFLAKGNRIIGLDTETTGLDVYSSGFELRLVQLGDRDEAFVLPAARFADKLRDVLRDERYNFVAHNASYDLLVLDRHLGVKIEELAPRTHDTYIYAHLLDPRRRHEGGAGLGLKELAELYVDETAPDTAGGLVEVFRKEYKATKATGWALIDLDHPTYVLYAGLDVILVRRLFDELAPMVVDLGCSDLAAFEHHLAGLLAIMQRRGVLVDVDYTEQLAVELREDAAKHRAAAARYGVENVNSTAQVSAALTGMGVKLRDRTPSGALKVDKAVLEGLANADQPNPLAVAVIGAKRGEKWATSYADAFLCLRDQGNRLHPSIRSLAARTGRMSISNPPLQQLPSKEWRIRRALIADPGHLIIASDYSAIEMRVLAALANEPTMKAAILDGLDLHSFTAEKVFGPAFTEADRKLAKGIGFGKVYGGGAATIVRQTGAPLDKVRDAIKAYDDTFPGIKAYGRHLQRVAEYGKREVITVTGRHLPLDRDRLYSATNYVCQSAARDVLADAIVRCFEAGLGDYLLMPVHDELVAQAPANIAAEVAAELGRTMAVPSFGGVPLTTEAKVYGTSWGHGYGAPS